MMSMIEASDVTVAIRDGHVLPSAAKETGQYTPNQILAIWASVALPMGFIYWVLLPMLMPRVTANPGLMYLVLITLGMVWQAVVAGIILRREVKPFTWENIKDRIWLHTLSDPRTCVASKWLYLWTIPLIAVNTVGPMLVGGLNDVWVKTLRFIAPPPYTSMQSMAGPPVVGQWWLLGVVAVMIATNYFLGEELIFRGILLPKMNGVFGRWDFIANNVLFSLYHLHKIAIWPEPLVLDWIYPWAAKRFKSYWMAVLIHGSEGLIIVVLVPVAIMGWLQN